jgi:hypothetical protein
LAGLWTIDAPFYNSGGRSTKIGFDVSDITTSSKYNEKSNNIKRKFKLFYDEYINGIRVSRCYIYRAPKNSIIKRILSHVNFNYDIYPDIIQ